MEEFLQTISNAEVIAIAILFAVIIVFGSFLNGLVIATYYKWSKTLLTDVKDAFMLSLALGDLLMSLLASPFAFSSTISREWTTGYAGCVWYGFITTWIGLSSMVHLTAMAVDRCVALSQLTLSTVPQSRGFKVISGCWLLAFVASCLPLFGWSKYTFEGYGFHCSISWDSQTTNNTSYGLFLMVVYFIIPIIVIVISYAKIYCIVRGIYLNADEMWGAHAQATKDSCKARVKTVKRFLLVTAGFVFAWTPYAIVCFFKMVGGFDIPLAYQEYPALCAKMSVVYNPLLYFFSYRRLRVRAIQILKVTENVVHSKCKA